MNHLFKDNFQHPNINLRFEVLFLSGPNIKMEALGNDHITIWKTELFP
jgi:hypothetical protein